MTSKLPYEVTTQMEIKAKINFVVILEILELSGSLAQHLVSVSIPKSG